MGGPGSWPGAPSPFRGGSLGTGPPRKAAQLLGRGGPSAADPCGDPWPCSHPRHAARPGACGPDWPEGSSACGRALPGRAEDGTRRPTGRLREGEPARLPAPRGPQGPSCGVGQHVWLGCQSCPRAPVTLEPRMGPSWAWLRGNTLEHRVGEHLEHRWGRRGGSKGEWRAAPDVRSARSWCKACGLGGWGRWSPGLARLRALRAALASPWCPAELGGWPSGRVPGVGAPEAGPPLRWAARLA